MKKNSIKIKFIALIIVVGIGSFFFFYWNKYESVLKKGRLVPASTKILDQLETKGFPNFSVLDIYGKELSLWDYKGKVIILNFWASWCAPCVQEFPSMLELVDYFKGDVVFLAISHDYDLEDLSNFLKAFKAIKKSKSQTLRVAWDQDKKISKMFSIDALPETFIIGTDMKLIRKVAGSENWATPEAISYFKSILKK